MPVNDNVVITVIVGNFEAVLPRSLDTTLFGNHLSNWWVVLGRERGIRIHKMGNRIDRLDRLELIYRELEGWEIQ